MDQKQSLLKGSSQSALHNNEPMPQHQTHGETRQKKVKVYPDDTSSYDGPAFNVEDEQRRDKRARRHAFRKFVAENKKAWLKFNTVVLIVSILFIVCNFFVGRLNETKNEGATCGNLSGVRYIDYVLHSVNVIITIINLTGLNAKLCHGNIVLGAFIFELIMLGWKQLIYFQAQSEEPSCMRVTPALYWWQFFQILMLYVGLVYLLCSFMRRYFPTEEPGSHRDEEFELIDEEAKQKDGEPQDNYDFLSDLNNQAQYRVEKGIKENVSVQVQPEMQVPLNMENPLAPNLGNIKMNVKIGAK